MNTFTDNDDDQSKPGPGEEPAASPQKGNPPETGRADKPRDRGDV